MLYNGITGNAKIIILKNLIDEWANDNQQFHNINMNINMKIEMIEEAYKALETEEKREQYIGLTLKQMLFLQKIDGLIEKYNGDPNQKVETFELMKNDTIKEVRKKESEIPEYDVTYEDEDITLCTKQVISFKNSMFANEITEYIIFLKEQTSIISGCDFFGNLIIPEMSVPEYKKTFFQAIKQNIEEQIKQSKKHLYIGGIKKSPQKEKKEYCIVKDLSQEQAILEYEKKKQQKRKEIDLNFPNK